MERKTDILLFLELQKTAIRWVENNIDNLKENLGKTEKAIRKDLNSHIKSDTKNLDNLKNKIKKSRFTGWIALILWLLLSLKSPEVLEIIVKLLPFSKNFF